MDIKLDRVTDKIFIAAFNEAKNQKHEYFTPEHILYSSLFFDEGKEIIINCDGDIDALKEDLISYFSENIPVVENEEPIASLGIGNIMQNSASHVLSSGRDIIQIGDIYASMLEEKESFAAYYLIKNGVSRLSNLQYISHSSMLSTQDEEYEEVLSDQGDAPEEDEVHPSKKKKFLEQYTVELVEKAASGSTDPLIGREDILRRTIQVLSRRTKNNPVHVGDPGVGKTAIAEGLARLISEGKAPKTLSDSKIYSIDISRYNKFISISI
jgi:ATP-dependent Clp protease ATP-binding subunit ClpA